MDYFFPALKIVVKGKEIKMKILRLETAFCPFKHKFHLNIKTGFVYV